MFNGCFRPSRCPCFHYPNPCGSLSLPSVGVVLSLAQQGVYVALMVLNVGIYLGLRFHKTESADNELAAIFE